MINYDDNDNNNWPLRCVGWTCDQSKVRMCQKKYVCVCAEFDEVDGRRRGRGVMKVDGRAAPVGSFLGVPETCAGSVPLALFIIE